MSFQWLQIRITEEKDRRERENNILNRLPAAFVDLRSQLTECIEVYNEAFPEAKGALEEAEGVIRVRAVDARVEIQLDPALPGFHIDQAAGRISIVVGVLPAGNLFFRDQDKYLSVEELTRRILDRALFPKLKD